MQNISNLFYKLNKISYKKAKCCVWPHCHKLSCVMRTQTQTKFSIQTTVNRESEIQSLSDQLCPAVIYPVTARSPIQNISSLTLIVRRFYWNPYGCTFRDETIHYSGKKSNEATECLCRSQTHKLDAKCIKCLRLQNILTY